MAHAKGDSLTGDQQTQEEHRRRGVFGKVKDKLDFTKHLGFQSDPDSFANREALERARAREAREAEEQQHGTEQEKQLGPQDGIEGIADTLAGAVAPKTGGTTSSSQASKTAAAAAEEQQGEQNHNKPVKFDQSPPDSPTEQADGKQEGSEGRWGHWVAHKLHQVSRAAASKDLSDELLKKESKAKHTK